MIRQVSKFAIPLLFIAVPLYFWFTSRPKPERAVPAAVNGTLILLASPGRVEGQGETISLGAAADGVVKSVSVTAGQHVAAGTVLAEIDCDDLKAEIEQAKSEAESERQARIRLYRGHRDEEKRAAEQNTAAAQSTLDQAQEHFQRIDSLFQKDAVARDLYEQTKRDYEVAKANLAMYRAEQDLIDAEPLPEEKAKADADLGAAEKNVRVDMEKFQKCAIRAPFAGTVLKIMAKSGESYSTLLPRPLFSFANDSVRRVRAEVDEWDIGKVKVGQRAIVTADGFPGARFNGRVVELAHVMGRKSVLSGDPAEKADRDVLEVVVELDPSARELPVGLRITTQFLNSVEKAGLSDPTPDSQSPDKPNAENAGPSQSGTNRELYNQAGAKASDTHLSLQTLSQAAAQPRSSASAASPARLSARQASNVPSELNVPLIPTGTIRVQVEATENMSEALALGEVLQIKKFPAFVIPPGRDKYYHVQVGPYADAQSALKAKHELEAQGFDSILK